MIVHWDDVLAIQRRWPCAHRNLQGMGAGLRCSSCGACFPNVDAANGAIMRSKRVHEAARNFILAAFDVAPTRPGIGAVVAMVAASKATVGDMLAAAAKESP